MRTRGLWAKIAAAAWVCFVFIVHYHLLASRLAAGVARYMRTGP
jgi:hypothetical protein